MINPVREIYEMEFRQRDLARELETHRRVTDATQGRVTGLSAFLIQVKRWWQVLGRLHKIRIEVSFDLTEPCPDSSPR